MDFVKERLKERSLLFLYVFASIEKKVNVNTFKRYLYLYYLSGSFFKKNMDNLTVLINKGNIKIPYVDSILDDFSISEFIDLSENIIYIKDELITMVDTMLKGKDGKTGEFYELYKEIKPFVNLLRSYDDQFVFTIFFSEPTFREAIERGLDQLDSSSSVLSKLLTEFKKKLNDENIDNYDILTHWMGFVLKNYYKIGESDGTNE